MPKNQDPLPDPDNLPDFQLPRHLINQLKEFSKDENFVLFLRTKDGVLHTMNFNDDLEMSGMMQFIVSFGMSYLQMNSENIANNLLRDEGLDEE